MNLNQFQKRVNKINAMAGKAKPEDMSVGKCYDETTHETLMMSSLIGQLSNSLHPETFIQTTPKQILAAMMVSVSNITSLYDIDLEELAKIGERDLKEKFGLKNLIIGDETN